MKAQRKRVQLTQAQRVDIIHAYSDRLERMQDLAEQYGVTRQAIHKILRKAGVDTSKRHLQVSCTTCGKAIERTKGRVRKQLHHFCSSDCYYAFLKAGNGMPYIQNGHGQRVARSVVSQYFQLQAKHVVHHEDRNNLNNMARNLRVFACQGDHVRYHRGFDVTPIWDGRTVQ